MILRLHHHSVQAQSPCNQEATRRSTAASREPSATTSPNTALPQLSETALLISPVLLLKPAAEKLLEALRCCSMCRSNAHCRDALMVGSSSAGWREAPLPSSSDSNDSMIQLQDCFRWPSTLLVRMDGSPRGLTPHFSSTELCRSHHRGFIAGLVMDGPTGLPSAGTQQGSFTAIRSEEGSDFRVCISESGLQQDRRRKKGV